MNGKWSQRSSEAVSFLYRSVIKGNWTYQRGEQGRKKVPVLLTAMENKEAQKTEADLYAQDHTFYA